MGKSYKYFYLVLVFTGAISLLSLSDLFAQAGCGANVPTFYVDLTGNPNGTWISPDTIRSDNCCGTSNPDRCVQFIITLDAAAQGISFDIFSGAIPPGAMYYQINCSPPVAVGTPICLSGAGPHYLTFCKPGNNHNQYIITSIGAASAQDDSVTTNCNSGVLVANNFYTPSTVWTSVYPGATGAYNSYLSCTNGCDTAFVTPSAGAPTYIDFQVCGQLASLCNTATVCDTARVYIYAPIQLSAPGNVCSGTATASVTAVSSGGLAPHTYLWNPTGQTTQTATGLSAGSYTVTVTDANGCSSNASFNIYAVENPLATMSPTNVSCYGGSNGSVMVTSSGGTSPYTYQWNSGQTTESITGLTIGTYSLNITDVNGCASTSAVSITQPATAITSSVTQTNVSCFGGSNGSASVTASGGTPGYTYLWSNGQTSSSITGLTAGNYSVTTTDANGCTSTISSISITQPSTPITSVSSQSNVTCNGGNNGSASVSVSGGTPGYTYLWNNGQTGSSISNLTALNYSVNITDANGCTTTTSFSITQPSGFSSTATQTNLCNSSTSGMAIVSASGGVFPYTYLWSNGQSSSSATGLSAGNYSVTTTDANGCTSMATVNITLFPTLLSNVTQTNVSCYGGSNGSASVSGSGGLPAYTYLWNTGQTASTITNLSPGNYSVTVTDNNGCTANNTVTISQPAILSAGATSVAATCNGGNNGSATAVVSGGTSPYSYFWNNWSTGAMANNLTAGNYTVTITDANGCTTTSGVTVNQPTPIVLTLSSTPSTCFQSDGSAMVTASGGTGSYTYLWSNGQTASTAINLSSSNYQVTVTDANNCIQTGTIQIQNNPGVNAVPVSYTTVSCSGGCNGTATVSATGGVSPYSFLWNTGATTTTLINLCAATYTVTVTDNTGCTSSTSFYITQPGLLSATITPANVTCNGADNGAALAAVNGGISPYTYSWNTGQTTALINNLTAGNYSLTVTDNSGCTASATTTIIEPSPVFITTNVRQDISCFGAADGLISVTGNGGTPGYSYSWLPNVGVSSAVNNLAPGSYTVFVQDQNSCKDSLLFTITEPPVLNVSVSSVSLPSCYNSSNGSASVATTGGTGPYQYFWSTSPIQTGATATNLSNGNYIVLVTDAHNCSDSLTVNLAQPSPVITTASASDTICLGQSVIISASASGGAGGYTYTWSPSLTGNGGTQMVSPTVSTTYTVTAHDQNNCFFSTDTVSIEVFHLAPGSTTMNGATPICPGQSTQVSVAVAGNPGPMTYSWNNGLGNTPGPHTVTPNQPTTYIVTITNSCGTTINDSIKINFNPPPTVLISADTLSGCTPVYINFSDQAVSGNSNDPIISWIWSFGDGTASTLQNPAHAYNTSGTYNVTLTVTTSQGCTNSNAANPILVNAHPAPNALFSVNSTNLRIPVDSLQCNNQSTGAVYYHWLFGDGYTSDQTNPTHTYTTAGFYNIQLIATNAYGCADTADMDIKVSPTVIFPSAFTPDAGTMSDGYYDPASLDNNIFFPYTAGVVEYHLMIFDRWGELIFETFDIKQGWNGYFKDKICQQDVYIYKAYMKFINDDIYRKTGDVTLIR